LVVSDEHNSTESILNKSQESLVSSCLQSNEVYQGFSINILYVYLLVVYQIQGLNRVNADLGAINGLVHFQYPLCGLCCVHYKAKKFRFASDIHHCAELLRVLDLKLV